MNAIHIIMATSNSANPHIRSDGRIENLAKKRKVSAITFLIFGVLLIIAGSLLASFEKQKFSVSFIVFGGIGIIFAFMYWISAEKILIALRKLNTERLRQARFHAQCVGTVTLENTNTEIHPNYLNSVALGLPSYEQSMVNRIDIPPPYEEAIKTETNINAIYGTNQSSSVTPIHSISLSVAQAAVSPSPTSPVATFPVTID